MMASLRTRLFVGLFALILATGLGAGGITFKWAFDEAIELQDSVLLQIGTIVVTHSVQRLNPAERGVDAEARIVIEELGNGKTEDQSVRLLPALPGNLPEGLQTVPRGQENWRLLVRTRPDGSRVAIGQPVAIRDEFAGGSALRTILPLAALIPCLMLLVGIVIRQSLRPVSRLAARLDAEKSDDFERLPLESMPTELRPFIASINRLLERIGAMVEQRKRFIADAAHELRSPITALGLQAENLDRADLPQESRERLASLKNGIRRTAHLLEQLLALARYDMGRATQAPVIALDLVARESVADFLPLASARGIDLGFERLETVFVRGEAMDLAIMLRNVLDNALRHTPVGGRIDISLYRQDDNAVIRIEDTGPGIPQTDLQRIFEPFFRSSRSVDEGTGLGLSIVHRIVEKHRGKTTIENTVAPDRPGLRVAVTIPASDPTPGSTAQRPASGPST